MRGAAVQEQVGSLSVTQVAADVPDGFIDVPIDGDQVETAEVHADDGTDLARKAPHVPLRRVVAELEVEAVEHGSIVRIGHDQQSAKLDAIEQQTAVGGSGIERQIGSRLEPLRDAIGPFGHPVERVVGNDAPRESSLPSAGRREVVVPGEVEPPRPRDLGVVDLDLVGLGPGRAGPRQHAGQQRGASSNRVRTARCPDALVHHHHRCFKCALSVTFHAQRDRPCSA